MKIGNDRNENYNNILTRLPYIPSTEGVVNRNFKYMRYFKNADSTHLMFEELYDLKNDPHETNNLVNQPQQQRLRDSLKCRMWALKKEAR